MLGRAILASREAHTFSAPAAGVDRFHERQAAASLSPVAARRGVGLNGLEKILQDGLVSSRVADNRRGRTGVVVRFPAALQFR
jgi:hypothetical protein